MKQTSLNLAYVCGALMTLVAACSGVTQLSGSKTISLNKSANSDSAAPARSEDPAAPQSNAPSTTNDEEIVTSTLPGNVMGGYLTCFVFEESKNMTDVGCTVMSSDGTPYTKAISNMSVSVVDVAQKYHPQSLQRSKIPSVHVHMKIPKKMMEKAVAFVAVGRFDNQLSSISTKENMFSDYDTVFGVATPEVTPTEIEGEITAIVDLEAEKAAITARDGAYKASLDAAAAAAAAKQNKETAYTNFTNAIKINEISSARAFVSAADNAAKKARSAANNAGVARKQAEKFSLEASEAAAKANSEQDAKANTEAQGFADSARQSESLAKKYAEEAERVVTDAQRHVESLVVQIQATPPPAKTVNCYKSFPKEEWVRETIINVTLPGDAISGEARVKTRAGPYVVSMNLRGQSVYQIPAVPCDSSPNESKGLVRNLQGGPNQIFVSVQSYCASSNTLYQHGIDEILYSTNKGSCETGYSPDSRGSFEQ